MKLTKAALAKLELPAGKAESTYYDSELRGFGLRLRAGGKRAWVAVYRLGSRVRRVTIGDSSVVSPEEARAKAREILAKANLGEDVHAQRKEEQGKAAVTLGSVIESYIAQYVEARQKPRTQLETKRHLRAHWRVLHAMPLHKVKRRDVATKLTELTSTSGPIAANRARSALSALFVWAVRQGIVEHNPVVGTAPPAPERSRERVLSPRDIGALWQATEGPSDYNAIVRLLLLTGQRREEVAAISWHEIDLDKAVWLLPAERTKNGLPHEVPLSRQVHEILAGIAPRDGRALVFGVGHGPFSGWSQSKARLDRRCGVADWRLHDLRRTVVTGMAELGLQPHVIEAVVNHVSGHKAGIAGVYNRATYAPEKRRSLQLWADHIAKICS